MTLFLGFFLNDLCFYHEFLALNLQDGLRMDGSHDPSNSMLRVHSSKMDPSEHEFLPGHDSMFNPDQRSDR